MSRPEIKDTVIKIPTPSFMKGEEEITFVIPKKRMEKALNRMEKRLFGKVAQ